MIGQRDIEENIATLRRIADLNSKLLWFRAPSTEIEALGSAIRTELQERGFVASDGNLLHASFWCDFQRHFLGLREISEFSSLFDQHAKTRIAGYLSRGKLPCSSLHTVLLIDYLFGSWESALEHCRWDQTFNAPCAVTHSNYPNRICEDELLHRHRRTCLTLMNEFPYLNRNEFARASPRSFRWLLAHDANWLSATIPYHHRTTQGKLPLLV